MSYVYYTLLSSIAMSPLATANATISYFHLLLQEVRLAIEYIVIPGGEPVELLPRRSDIVARQLELVKSYQLAVENSGTESNPRLQILPHKLSKKASSFVKVRVGQPGSVSARGGGTGVARLPFLPE